MKLKIKGQSPQESERILAILWKVLKEDSLERQTDPVHCNTTLEEELDYYGYFPFKRHKILRKLALHIFGNTLDATIMKTAELTIVGDGECSECGSNDFNRDFYRTCKVCGYAWYAYAEMN